LKPEAAIEFERLGRLSIKVQPLKPISFKEMIVNKTKQRGDID
jgi:negative regulator of genetic competence, sporulation and motility